jgi:hypothetical protein
MAMSSSCQSVAKTSGSVAYCNRGSRWNRLHEDKGGQSRAAWDTQGQGVLHSATDAKCELTYCNNDLKLVTFPKRGPSVAIRSRDRSPVITINLGRLHNHAILYGKPQGSTRRLDGTSLAQSSRTV